MSKAVILKGPQADSKSYVTVLPESMEALLKKAKDLFTIPPNHTPHFTLADDSSAIVLPDFLPLIREREVLIFRWSPDTPRSSLRHSIVQPAVTAQPEAIQGSSRPLEDSTEYNKASRGVRWDENVVSNEEKNKRNIARARVQKENRDSSTSRHRAEYVRQKIQEQEELRQKEADADVIDERQIGSNHGIRSNINDTTHNLSKEDLLVSGSSPPSYSSPKQRDVEQQSDEENQTSSPLASPTRDIRGARDVTKAWKMGLGREKESLVGEDRPTHAEADKLDAATLNYEATARCELAAEDQDGERTASFKDSIAAEMVEESNEQPETSDDHSREDSSNTDLNEDLEEEQAVEQATSPQKAPEVNVKNIPAYQTMKSVVSQLRCHPSNHFFRQPCEDDLVAFCHERNRPVVDLFTISDSITLGKYGLDNPLKEFNQDLSQMWNNIRTFYAPQSQQTQSANVLEVFSGILLQEWTRSSTTSTRPIKSRPNTSRSYSTPMSRREKHHGQQQQAAPGQDGTPTSQQAVVMANLRAKGGFFPSASPSSMIAKLGQTLKRSATSAPKTQRPAKKAVISEVNSTSPATVDSEPRKDNVAAPSIVTRGGAKRAVA